MNLKKITNNNIFLSYIFTNIYRLIELIQTVFKFFYFFCKKVLTHIKNDDIIILALASETNK